MYLSFSFCKRLSNTVQIKACYFTDEGLVCAVEKFIKLTWCEWKIVLLGVNLFGGAMGDNEVVLRICGGFIMGRKLFACAGFLPTSSLTEGQCPCTFRPWSPAWSRGIPVLLGVQGILPHGLRDPSTFFFFQNFYHSVHRPSFSFRWVLVWVRLGLIQTVL